MADRRRALDYFILAGVRSPGILDPREPFRTPDDPRMFDKRQGYGLSGALLIYRGRDLSNFSAIIQLYPPGGDIEKYLDTDPEWRVFKALIDKVPTTRVQFPMYSIVHAYLRECLVKDVVVVNQMAVKQAEPGMWVKEVRFSTNHPLKAMLAKPFGKTGVPVPVTAKEKEFDSLANAIALRRAAGEQ
jgi:hypothetical protein